MNECFLVNAGSKYGIGLNLPLRLQKRTLLRTLGFPGDPNLKACKSSETRKVKQLVKEYGELGYPFLIIVSEKPMRTLVPPLFVVNNQDNVQWRDGQGAKRIITTSEVLAIIERYPPTTWVEFAPSPWGEQTVAGRLIYTSMKNQILEMQQGNVPARLINDRQLPTYVGDLSFMEASRRGYLEDSHRLRDVGYFNICSFTTVQSICREMPPLTQGCSLQS